MYGAQAPPPKAFVESPERRGKQDKTRSPEFSFFPAHSPASPGRIINPRRASPYIEKTSGTDWEWWISSSRIGWIRYPVQEKRADKASGRYSTLTHKVRGTRQVDLLAQYARTKKAVPLYCFYNYPFAWVSQKHWQCCSSSFEPEQLACTIAPIGEVTKAIDNNGCKNFKWLHQRPWVVPWRCLAGCPRIRQAQRRAMMSTDPIIEHPLALHGARIFPRLPNEVSTAFSESADGGLSIPPTWYH
jgi:hypothetical protein